ncbi:NADPH-ferredoxin reductase fprA [Nocardia farcinica]|uniref:ferredoxin--NADP(+) reductase n=1 Tax=Nocardia farcinica TaxID=37329 RepID=A0A449HDB0_NOCFR|nr:FAD-dependent oxidoreductase [Nocardia farcinica]VFA95935.1 NADPH-ferredoxin reductase fprA [Nocardia farcinica]
MAYVITQRCCNDASCVAECPVDCIRPRPEDPEFTSAEMLYIDPATCIDCGACFEACPVGAVYAEDELPAQLDRYREINADWFARHPMTTDLPLPAPPARLPAHLGTLRVAIVGTGPAACYAAEHLLAAGNVEVEMFDRLPTPWGLVRHGVAPDHGQTRAVAEMFAAAIKRDAVQLHLNVTVGEHVAQAELLDSCHAVIYAVGASADRELGIPGENLPGSHSGTDFVAWYNGHPEHADFAVDLSGERAVVIGNGNVALDIARVLTADPDELARTDIADHALAALRDSRIREVVVLGRRGPAQAAYTGPEFLALAHLSGVDVIVDPADLTPGPGTAVPEGDDAARRKVALAHEYASAAVGSGRRRIRFGYRAAPTAILGTDRVTGVEYARTRVRQTADGVVADLTEDRAHIEASLVLRATGYRGVPVPDVPFDPERGIVPNAAGRVLDAPGGRPVPGLYVTGWIKRGARGVIGSNRGDSAETVQALLADFHAGLLPTPAGDRTALTALIRTRQPDVVDRTAWQDIDRAERAAGAATGRPRVKLTSVEALLATARRG